MVLKQQANTIILEMGKSSKEDLRDLRYGEGKMFKRLITAIRNLRDSGEIAEDAQPVIIVVKEKDD